MAGRSGKKKRPTWFDISTTERQRGTQKEHIKVSGGILAKIADGGVKDRGPDGIHGVNWIGDPTNWEDVIEAVSKIPRRRFP